MESEVHELPYTRYSRYLTRTHGCRVYRVAVDGGFSCPNRDDRLNGQGSRAREERTRPNAGGCRYCAEDGGRAPYLDGAVGVSEQVRRAVAFLSARYEAKAFILYFQAFSGTYATPAELARIYDAGLAAADFRGLVISTRPDCIDEEKAALIASYRARGLDVWVELGLQSANDETLGRVGRGHDAACFLSAYRTLKAAGCKVAVHLILGLPGETQADMERTAEFLSPLNPDGVKIHNLHIPAGTGLADELLKGEIAAPGPERHMDCTIAVLERLPPTTVIMRLTTDTPRVRLLAPRFFMDKQAFASMLAREMERRGTRQGIRCGTGDARRA